MGEISIFDALKRLFLVIFDYLILSLAKFRKNFITLQINMVMSQTGNKI